MSTQVDSAFKNSCVKTPINPLNHHPHPTYERGSLFKEKCVIDKSDELKKEKNVSFLLDFYESIPDYKDINHLSQHEFDAKLQSLKQRQIEINEYFFSGNNNPKSEPNTTIVVNSHEDEKNVEICGNDDWHDEKRNICKDNKINKANNMFRSDACRKHQNRGDLDFYPLPKNRNKSASPFRSTCQEFASKSFKTREEDERTFEDLVHHSKSNDSLGNIKKKTIKTNPIPLTSKIPLYNNIMCEQEHRNQLAKLNSAIELQSQMKPFTFFEKLDRHRCHSHSNLSSPQLSVECDSKNKNSSLRTKRLPSNTCNNYFYHRMWEDEYFRTLNRKLRAEEMLKKSSLPPSMQKRDKTLKLERNNSATSSKKVKRKNRVKRKTSDHCHLHNKIGNNEFITTCPEPFEFETEKRSFRRTHSHKSSGSISPCSKFSSHNPSPMPIYPAARPNLAANLRLELARKKLDEMNIGSEKTFPKEKLRRPSWGVRRSPAWKSLSYENTNDEDISLRLATRRAEDRLRQEEYKANMELMRQRVKAAPLLLEGPTHWGPNVGRVTHSCSKRTASEFKKHKSFSCYRNHSKLSNYSDGYYTT